MRNIFHSCVWLVTLGAAGILMASCQKEEDRAVPESLYAGEACVFSLEEVDPDPVMQETKSLLTDPTIESKQTCATVAVYAGGELVEKKHFTGSLSAMSFDLPINVEYTAYALVNMGDMRSVIPASSASLPSLTYTIPSYTGSTESVNSRGIPMAGSLTFTPGDNQTAIPVRRLLAKVTATLSCDWAGAKIQNAKVYNMNKTLRPFGTSSATGSSDMLSFQELETADTPAGSLIAVFYVPENVQNLSGTGITSSNDKAGDRNAVVAANADKLTYLETEVASTGKYEGTVKYRSYLGANATTDFSIVRNKRYSWTVHYYSAKVDDYTSDWKHDLDDLTVADYSLSLSPNPQTVAVGSNFSYTTTLTRNVLYPTASSTSSTLPNTDSNLIWETDDSGVATVNKGVVTGVAHGTTTIRARYTPSGADFTERVAVATVNVDNITHELVISPAAPAAADWQETVHLSATYYTLTNGVRDSGTDVTLDAGTTWSRVSGSSSVSVAKGATYADVTATNYGVARIGASYAGVSAEPVEVTFNRTDYALLLSHTPTNAKANQTIQMSAKLRTTTNGVATDTNLPATQVSWSVLTATQSDPTAAVSVSATGVVSTNKAVTVQIQGSYAGVSPAVSATEEVSFEAVTDKYLQIVGSPLEKNVGETITLTAKLHTVTDGVDDGGVTVTATWANVSGSDNISVTNGSVTASDYGTATIRASYESYTDEVTVTFHKTVHSLVVSPASSTANVGQTISLTATYYTYYDGVQTGAQNVTVASGTSWTRDSGAATISVTKGSAYAEVTAVTGATHQTEAWIRATYAGESATAHVIFNDVIDYDLVITPSTQTARTYVSPGSLTATSYTLTNGMPDAGQDVTSSATWNTVDGTASKYTISAPGIVHATPTAGSPSVAGDAKVQATYGGKTSNKATVSFVDVITYGTVVTPASQSVSWRQPGQTLASFAAAYKTYTNGFETASSNVTASATWAVSDGTNFIVSAGAVEARNATAASTKVWATASGAKSNEAQLTVNPVTTHTLQITSHSGSFTAFDNEALELSAIYKTYVNGVLTTSQDVTGSAGWSSSNSKVTTSWVSPYRNVVTTEHNAANLPLSSNITATYLDADPAVQQVSFQKFDVITHELEVTPASASGDYQNDVAFTATYWTLTNGVRTSSVNVTSTAQWSVTQPLSTGCYSVSGGVVHATPTAAHPSVAGSPVVTATYNALSDNSTATFSDVYVKTITVKKDDGTSVEGMRIAVSAQRQLKAWYNKVLNGFVQYDNYIAPGTSGAVWSQSSSAPAKVSVSSTGLVTGLVVGTATVTMTYDGASGSAVVEVIAWSDDWDDPGEEIEL